MKDETEKEGTKPFPSWFVELWNSRIERRITTEQANWDKLQVQLLIY